MARSSPICNWPKASGTPRRSAPKSVLSLIADAPMTPTWWHGSGGWRAVSCGGVPRRRSWRKSRLRGVLEHRVAPGQQGGLVDVAHGERHLTAGAGQMLPTSGESVPTHARGAAARSAEHLNAYALEMAHLMEYWRHLSEIHAAPSWLWHALMSPAHAWGCRGLHPGVGMVW
jgi:hypothetical protein